MRLFWIYIPSKNDIEEEWKRAQEINELYIQYLKELVNRIIQNSRTGPSNEPWYRRFENRSKY